MRSPAQNATDPYGLSAERQSPSVNRYVRSGASDVSKT